MTWLLVTRRNQWGHSDLSVKGKFCRGTVDGLGWEHEGLGGVGIFVIFKRFTKNSPEFWSQHKFYKTGDITKSIIDFEFDVKIQHLRR